MIAPVLSGDALAAVRRRGSHLQIIASADSGKTEVVAQRSAKLMADGTDAAGIIAFTFTERAAQELKARISARVEQEIGPQALNRLGASFVGGHYMPAASGCFSSTCRGTRPSMYLMSGG